MGTITGIFHGGITVSDMDRSLEFYRDGLGLEVEFDTIIDGPYLPVVLDLQFSHIRAVYLRLPGGVFLELLEYHGIERLSAASRPCDYGAGHVCLYVEGIDDIVAGLARAWLRCPLSGPCRHHGRSQPGRPQHLPARPRRLSRGALPEATGLACGRLPAWRRDDSTCDLTRGRRAVYSRSRRGLQIVSRNATTTRLVADFAARGRGGSLC